MKKIIATLLLVSSCTTYTTALREDKTLADIKANEVVKSEACSNNLFGGFKIPYFGDTAILVNGDESAMAALKAKDLTKIYVVDTLVKTYVVYTKKCTILYGK